MEPDGHKAGDRKIEVVQATDAHAPAIAEFIRAVWTPSATAESVASARASAAAHNVADPGVPPPTWIAVRGGTVLGYVTTIPIRLWNGRSELPAYWVKGLMVLPEFRNGPIGYAVMKAAAAGLPRSAGLAAALPARRLFSALGYADLGPIPNLVRPIAMGRILDRIDLDALGLAEHSRWARPVLRFVRASGLATLLGALATWALRGWTWMLRSSGRRFSRGLLEDPVDPSDLDGLWLATRDRFPTGAVRDARYLLERYPLEGASPYLWVAVRLRGRLAGVAILRHPRSDGDPRLKGIRVATLADLLYLPAEGGAGLALLGAVEDAARTLGADAILASASAPELQGLLRRQGYLQIGGNVHLLFRDATDLAPSFASPLTGWWMTRGDGQSDEVF